MFFILSKTVAFLLLPSNFVVVVGLAGLALMATRWRCAGTRMMVVSLILLVAIGLSPVGRSAHICARKSFSALGSSARRAGRHCSAGGQYLAQVFHATTANRRSATMPRALLPWPSSREAYPNARIVYSGGDASLLGNQPPEADFVRPLLDSFGIRARARIIGITFPQYRRKCRIHQGFGASQSRGALAVGDLGTTHAARDRLFPSGRISDRGLSGWLARRPEIRPDVDQNIFEGLSPVRFRRV